MLVRLRTYLAALERAAAAEATVARLESHLIGGEREAMRAARELAEARAEIRRLTDVIISLKEQRFVVPPGHGDEVWGRYVMDDGAPKPDQREPASEVEAADRELLREIHAALEAPPVDRGD